VWLHSGEDDLTELKRNVLAACRLHKVPIEELNGWLFLTSFEELPLKVANGYHDLKLDSALIGRIKRTILDNEIDVFIADPLVTLHGAPENDNGKMDQVMRILIGIAITGDCGVDITHHLRRTEERPVVRPTHCRWIG
jgi:AAA domain